MSSNSVIPINSEDDLCDMRKTGEASDVVSPETHLQTRSCWEQQTDTGAKFQSSINKSLRRASGRKICRQKEITKYSTMSRVTPTTANEIEGTFLKFDADDNGSIGTKEMALVQKAMEHELGAECARKVISLADVDKDNVVTKSEFLVLMHQFKREKMRRVRDGMKLFQDQNFQDKVEHATQTKTCCTRRKMAFIHTLKSLFCVPAEWLIIALSAATMGCVYPLLKYTYTVCAGRIHA